MLNLLVNTEYFCLEKSYSRIIVMKQKLICLILCLLAASTVVAKPFVISGKITDGAAEPLIAVTVIATYADGTSDFTISDAEGKYSMSVRDEADIEFNLLGFQPYIIHISAAGVYDAVLNAQIDQLSESVVVGYGVQKKANMTGAVSTVKFDDAISGRATLNASSVLAGMSPGMTVQQSSGQPGSSGASITIRGNGTLNSNSPLVLVDGIEWDMDAVNTEDIASITILKDAASAAIYGSRAANGVILVTTRSGSGKPSVNYTFSGSFLSAQNSLSFVSDYARHMELINEGALNVESTPVFNQSTIDKWRAAAQDPNGLNEYGVPNYMAYPNTDWFAELVSTGFTQKHNLSVSGSSDRVNYYLSLGYVDTDGIMNNKGMDSGYRQIQFRTNLEAKVFNWMSLGARVNVLRSRTGVTNISRCFEYIGMTTPGFYPGEDNKWGIAAASEENSPNNIFQQMGRRGDNKNFKSNISLYLILKPVKGLSIEGTANYSPDWNDYNTYGFPNGTWNYVTNTRYTESALSESTIYNKSVKRQRINTEILARYNLTVAKDHDIAILAGFTTSSYRSSQFDVSKKGMSSWELTELNTAAELKSSNSSSASWSLMSFFGRVNYAWRNKYLFEANLRVDGSSRFSPARRWGYFPSFSVGWNLAKEPFMDFASRWLSYFKIRGSWGMLGNNASGNYDWQDTYSSNKVVIGGIPSSGFAISKLGNDKLSWESTTTTNLGFDFGFFDNRLTGELELYNKHTSGILYAPSIPITMGNVTPATANIAEVNNKGVELSLGWRDSYKDFSYSIQGNFSFNDNRVTKYKGELERYWTYDDKGNPIAFENNYGEVAQSGFGGVITEGRLLGEMYLRKLYRGTGNYAGGVPDIHDGPRDGIIRTEADLNWVRAMMAEGYTFSGRSTVSPDQLWYGDLIYDDLNGNRNYGDSNDMNFTGRSSLPRYNFGLNISLAYKGVDFYMLWAGCAGFDIYWHNEIYNGVRVKNGYGISRRVADDHYFYDYQNPSDPRTNINATYPRLSIDSERDNSAMSEFWAYKGDYLKLKNIQVGYTLPSKISKKAAISKLRLYLSAENLLTITSYPGLDPEIGSAVTYPLTRQYTIGLNLTF